MAKEQAVNTPVSAYDPEFQVRSVLSTIRANTELMLESSGPDRAALRRANAKLRQKIRAIQEQMITDYDPGFVECRDLGHVWTRSFTEQTGENVMQRMLLCDRCESERHETYDSDGMLLSRQYRHAQGYLLEPELASMLKHSRDFWRGIDFTIRATDNTE